jgi:hypothetical protein
MYIDDDVCTSSAHAVAYSAGTHKAVMANHPKGETLAVVTDSHSNSVHRGEDGPTMGRTYASTRSIVEKLYQ